MAALEARQDQGNGTHDSASTRTPYAREMGGTAPCPLRPLCGAHCIHAGHSGGGLPQGSTGLLERKQVPDALLKIDELHRLKSKKSSLEEALTDTVTRPQRKAVVPSKEVTVSAANQPQPGPLDCSEVQLHGNPLVDHLGGLGQAVGI